MVKGNVPICIYTKTLSLEIMLKNIKTNVLHYTPFLKNLVQLTTSRPKTFAYKFKTRSQCNFFLNQSKILQRKL